MKRDWAYEMLDKSSHTILRTDRGFDSESDAELQAAMEAKAENIKNFYVRTFQPVPEDQGDYA